MNFIDELNQKTVTNQALCHKKVHKDFYQNLLNNFLVYFLCKVQIKSEGLDRGGNSQVTTLFN